MSFVIFIRHYIKANYINISTGHFTEFDYKVNDKLDLNSMVAWPNEVNDILNWLSKVNDILDWPYKVNDILD